MSNEQIHLADSQQPPVIQASRGSLSVGSVGVILGSIAIILVGLSFASELWLIIGTLTSIVGAVVAGVSLIRQVLRRGPFAVALVGLLIRPCCRCCPW